MKPKWLQARGGTLFAVGRIATHFCILTTVMDGNSHDFKAILTEDCAVELPMKFMPGR